jgi:hypothetical protein
MAGVDLACIFGFPAPIMAAIAFSVFLSEWREFRMNDGFRSIQMGMRSSVAIVSGIFEGRLRCGSWAFYPCF